ncbi:MAG: hypothetical protein P9X27_02300 [Candidatus Kaelpia aquatica]|nr:hypothetical protein [Candidatus Kaelpia aquatica]
MKIDKNRFFKEGLLICLALPLLFNCYANFYFRNIDTTRRIKVVRTPSTMHGFAIALFDNYDQTEFTREDVQSLFGWAQGTANQRLKCLVEFGVLEVEEGMFLSRSKGWSPYKYHFKDTFNSRDNIMLLVAVKELYRAQYESQELIDVAPTVKQEINTLLSMDAFRDINIALDVSLETESRELFRAKFLAALHACGLTELYASFREIKISKGEKTDIRYDLSENTVSITLTEEEVSKAGFNSLWNLFGEKPDLRTRLVEEVFVEYAGYDTEEDRDLLHIGMTLMGDIYGNWYDRLREGEFVPYLPYLIYVHLPYEWVVEGRQKSDYPDSGILPIEMLIRDRDRSEALSSIYELYVAELNNLVVNLEESLSAFSDKQKKMLMLRFGVSPQAVKDIDLGIELSSSSKSNIVHNQIMSLFWRLNVRRNIEPSIHLLDQLFKIYQIRRLELQHLQASSRP